MKIKKKIFFTIILIFFFFINTKIHAENSLYEINGKKISYTKNNEVIIAEGDAIAKDQYGKQVSSDKIVYDKKNSIIFTDTKSIYIDTKGNTLIADNFTYDLKLKIIKANNNVKYLDKEGNIFYFSNLQYNETNEVGAGNYFKGFLVDKSSVEGSRAEFNNKSKVLVVENKKNRSLIDSIFKIFEKESNTFTPCEQKDNNLKTIKENCPDWRLETQKTIFDKNTNMVYHYGSVLKIKDIPVFYTPYFSHPDSSVKRKSGFLPPTIKNFTDLGQTIKIPYYLALDQNKDLTFSPIYYFDERPIFLIEYRQQNNKSKFYLDSSYTEGYKHLNYRNSDGDLIQRSSGSKNHFFFNFLGNYDDLLFSKNDLEINVQRISQKNYLNVNQINTEHVRQDITSLNSNIILNSYENNKKLSLRGNIYENLNDDNKDTKYQYLLPSINFSNFFREYKQNINLTNSLEMKNVGGNSNQAYQINNIETTSDGRISSFLLDGVNNVFKSSFNNINFYNQNIAGQKENLNNDLYISAAIESTYPLIKIHEKNEQVISPKIFAKFTNGSTNVTAYQNKILSYSDIYSLNRSNSAIIPETGASIGYGAEYNTTYKNINNEVYLKSNFAIGQIIRDNKQFNTEDKSTISDKRSAYVGHLNFQYDVLLEKKSSSLENNSLKDAFKNNNYTINYDFVISKNLNKLLKNQIVSDVNFGNNYISTNYYETHDISNEHYIDFRYTKKMDNNINFLLGGRKNIQDNFTENNFIETNYETDCLKVAINLTKTFYQNEEIKPSNNLTLSIVLKPFGKPVSPDLSSFLK